uniref:Uncharacterized protein n=1 Tax=Lotus japonicus TaxID=34305 RepID=I3SZK2_LOTJA|nr:unknown [Lotus japonicus]
MKTGSKNLPKHEIPSNTLILIPTNLINKTAFNHTKGRSGYRVILQYGVVSFSFIFLNLRERRETRLNDNSVGFDFPDEGLRVGG